LSFSLPRSRNPLPKGDSPAPDDIADLDVVVLDVGDVDDLDVAEAAGPEIAGPEVADPEVAESEKPSRRHVVAVRVRTTLAALLVFAALVAPDDYGHLTPAAFLRIPVEGLVVAVLLIVIPARARRIAAAVLGALLGLLAILKVVDIGFFAFLGRPFDLVLDWSLLGPAMSVVKASVGELGAIATVVGAVLLVAALLILMTRSVLRLSSLAARHDRATLSAVVALAVVWITCAALGAQLVPGVPVADRGTAALVYDRAQQVHAGLNDGQQFSKQQSEDVYASTPGDQLLTGLRGKDVIVTFVESYGRSAIEDPSMAPQVDAVLDAGTSQLDADGFAARSGFLTSSTVGGGSWLAHASLFSGLWINNQQRYKTLTSGDRLTLPSVFKRAGWRTMSFEPAITGNWPERVFYGYDKGYDRPSIDYHGPQFSYAPIPDQYTFAQLQKKERAPGHKPIMAEMTLVSSHTPFTPLPKLLDWNALGDGSVYKDPSTHEGGPGSSVLGSSTKLRDAYQKSIQYTLSTIVSYLEKYGDKNLVLVFLGDHQPSPLITGAGASKDVPITIVARDPAVLDRISDWGWTPGLRPDPKAPVWPMDAFRNRFLTAFGNTPATH
jgi:hypothetical protein